MKIHIYSFSLTFRSLIHVELTFVSGVKYRFDFVLLHMGIVISAPSIANAVLAPTELS